MNSAFVKKIIALALFMGIAVPSNAMMRQIASRTTRTAAAGLARMPKAQFATAAKQAAKNSAPLRNRHTALKVAAGLGLASATTIAACDGAQKVNLPFEIRHAICPEATSRLDKLWNLRAQLCYNNFDGPYVFPYWFNEINETLSTWYQTASQEQREAAARFAAAHFDKMDPDTLLLIFEKDPDATKHFVEPALARFDKTDRRVLCSIVEKNPDHIEQFTQAAITHFNTTTLHYITDKHPLKTIMDKNPDAIQKFAELAIVNIETVSGNIWWVIFVGNERKPKVTKQFTQLALAAVAKSAQPLEVLQRMYLHNLLDEIMDKNPDATKKFAQLALANIEATNTNVLHAILERTPAMAKEFTKLVLDKINSVPPEIIATIQYYDKTLTPDRIIKALDPELLELIHSRTTRDSIVKTLDPELFETMCADEPPMSQTLNHIHHNMISVAQMFVRYQKHIPVFKRIIQKGLELKEGFDFYHGQRLSHYAAEYIDTQLLGIQKGIPVDDYLLLHTKENPIDEATRNLGIEQPGKDPRKYLATAAERYLAAYNKEEWHHEQLCNNPDYQGRPFVLYANDSLTGNRTSEGSDSIQYFHINGNIGSFDKDTHNTVDDIFRHRYLEKYLAEFAPKFQKLREKLENASAHGVLQMIVVPEEHVEKMVAPAHSGGHRASLVVNGQSTDDMKTIAPALRTASYVRPYWGVRASLAAALLRIPIKSYVDYDQKEYMIFMTHAKHGALNPQSGIKVYSFFAEADREAIENIKKEIDAEAAKLRAQVEVDKAAAAL